MNKIIYWLNSAYDNGVRCHPSIDMRQLGIEWDNATWEGHTLNDCITVIASHIPEGMPSHIEVRPTDYPGFTLDDSTRGILNEIIGAIINSTDNH